MMPETNSRSANIRELIRRSESNDMKRTLGPFGLTLLGIGAIVGGGIFTLTGIAAAEHAGPALVLSFVLSGLGCAFAGLCYAEFAAMIPVAGSAYTYAYATMGRLVAWIIGWDLILEYLFGAATVASSWSGYVFNFFDKNLGIGIPPEWGFSTGTHLVNIPQDIAPVKEFLISGGWQPITGTLEGVLKSAGLSLAGFAQTTSIFNLPAALAIFVVTALLVVGIRESARFNNIAVIIKVAVVLLFILFGWGYIDSDNWVPFIPANTGTYGEFGLSGIVAGAAVIFFAYIGFDAVSTVAQEAKNPQRTLPIGILASLLVCSVLYIIVTLVLTGITPYTQLNVAYPIAYAIDSVGEGLVWLSPIIKIGAIAGLSSVMLVMLMAQPRIFYSMSKDGLLPEVFSRIHPKFRTPYIPTMLTGFACALVAGFFPVSDLGHMVSIGTLLAFAMVCVGIIVLRRNMPEIPRPFRTPWVPVVPILGAAICLYQMLSLPLETWLRLLAWMALGFAIYYLYGRNRDPLPSGHADGGQPNDQPTPKNTERD